MSKNNLTNCEFKIQDKSESHYEEQTWVINGPWREKVGDLASSLTGNVVILTEKIKKYRREICHTGGKFGQTGGKF